MKYDGLIFMLLQNNGQQAVVSLFSKKTNLLRFTTYEIGDDSTIAYFFVDVHEDNSIHLTVEEYTLTRAT